MPKKIWDGVFCLQVARFGVLDSLVAKLKAPCKGAVIGNDVYIGALERAINNRLIYTRLSGGDEPVFILEKLRAMMENLLHASFKLPDLSLPFNSSAAEEAVARVCGFEKEEEYIVFVISSSCNLRDWKKAYFYELAEKLSHISSRKILLLGSSSDVKEIKNIQEMETLPNIINLFNKTTLDDAMKLASRAKYAVCEDTALMHAALIGGAETVCLSNGMYNHVFVQYPHSYGVKQHLFYPPAFNKDSAHVFSDADINTITPETVWEHIKNNWKL